MSEERTVVNHNHVADYTGCGCFVFLSVCVICLTLIVLAEGGHL